MKRNLWIAGSLVAVASLAIGIVVMLPPLQNDDDTPKTIKSNPGPIAALPKKEPVLVTPPARKTDGDAAKEKKISDKTPPIEKKVVKVEPEPKKIDIKTEPKEEKKTPAKVKPEPKKNDVKV